MVDQIQKLNQQANEINIELNYLKNEFDKYYHQKVKLNEEFFVTVKKLKISKKNRDNLNFKVQFLKSLRSKSQNTFIKKLNQLKELRKKNSNVPFDSEYENRIKKKFDKEATKIIPMWSRLEIEL